MTARERILIVEDDAIIAESLRCMLVDAGYAEPTVVASGEAALDAVGSQSLALALMDIRLAGKLDGIATAERIHALSDVPVVYLTAYDEDSLLERAKGSVPYGYLVKPVSGRELKATIEMALYRHAIDQRLAASEKALRESEEQSRALLELGGRSGEAIVMLQDDERGEGMCVYANEPLCSMTGYSEDELLSLSLFDLVHPRDRDGALERHRQRMNGTVMQCFTEVTLIGRDGRDIPVESTFAYSFYRGRPMDVGFIRDIAARRMVEAHVIATQQLAATGAMACEAVTSLDGALESMTEASEALCSDPALSSEARDVAERVVSGIRGIRCLVDGLALFADGHDLGATTLDVNELVDSVLQLRVLTSRTDGIHLRKSLAAGLPPVVADGFLLRQVLLNIVANAEYFMSQARQGGVLTISTGRLNDSVQVSVADTGPGISAGYVDELLGPALASISPLTGVGFSMDVCRRIVEAVGGEIHVVNEPGKGTAYTIELPCESAAI